MIHQWDEAIEFYEKSIFEEVKIKINLIKDVNVVFKDHEEKRLQELQKRFSHILEDVINVDNTMLFKQVEEVLCPAGQRYFRIWNDGTIQGCPYHEKISLMGNLKKRDISINNSPIKCSAPKYCDCNWALLLT